MKARQSRHLLIEAETKTMLTNTLTTLQAQLATLADSWLRAGAMAFGVWKDEQMLAQWPDEHQPQLGSIVVPIQVENEVVGNLHVAGVSGSNAQARLMAEANLLAHLIKLEERLQSTPVELIDSRDHVMTLYELTQSMRNHTAIEKVLRCLTSETMRLMNAQGGFAVFVPSAAVAPTLVQYATPLLNEALIWRLFWQNYAEEREVLLSGDHAAELLPDGVHNCLLLPIWVRGTVKAGLGLFNRPGNGFTPSDVRMVREMAAHTSTQIEQILRHEEATTQTTHLREIELARRVQRLLLPQQVPQVRGLDIFAYSRPALEVGGDFYDFVRQPERPFTFSVGDVTGKGLSAALLMTMTRTAIHSKAQFMPKPTPATILRNSNEDLYNDFVHIGVFATAFVGQYQPFDRRLIYANAGHSPVIYRPADGTPRLLRADSTALGILPIMQCENKSLAIENDDLLVVATDGLSEACNHNDDIFGNEQLLALVEALAHKSAREIAEALFNAVDWFAASDTREDDKTLVVIKGTVA